MSDLARQLIEKYKTKNSSASAPGITAGRVPDQNSPEMIRNRFNQAGYDPEDFIVAMGQFRARSGDTSRIQIRKRTPDGKEVRMNPIQAARELGAQFGWSPGEVADFIKGKGQRFDQIRAALRGTKAGESPDEIGAINAANLTATQQRILRTRGVSNVIQDNGLQAFGRSALEGFMSPTEVLRTYVEGAMGMNYTPYEERSGIDRGLMMLGDMGFDVLSGFGVGGAAKKAAQGIGKLAGNVVVKNAAQGAAAKPLLKGLASSPMVKRAAMGGRVGGPAWELTAAALSIPASYGAQIGAVSAFGAEDMRRVNGGTYWENLGPAAKQTLTAFSETALALFDSEAEWPEKLGSGILLGSLLVGGAQVRADFKTWKAKVYTEKAIPELRGKEIPEPVLRKIYRDTQALQALPDGEREAALNATRAIFEGGTNDVNTITLLMAQDALKSSRTDLPTGDAIGNFNPARSEVSLDPARVNDFQTDETSFAIGPQHEVAHAIESKVDFDLERDLKLSPEDMQKFSDYAYSRMADRDVNQAIVEKGADDKGVTRQGLSEKEARYAAGQDESGKFDPAQKAELNRYFVDQFLSDSRMLNDADATPLQKVKRAIAEADEKLTKNTPMKRVAKVLKEKGAEKYKASYNAPEQARQIKNVVPDEVRAILSEPLPDNPSLADIRRRKDGLRAWVQKAKPARTKGATQKTSQAKATTKTATPPPKTTANQQATGQATAYTKGTSVEFDGKAATVVSPKPVAGRVLIRYADGAEERVKVTGLKNLEAGAAQNASTTKATTKTAKTSGPRKVKKTSAKTVAEKKASGAKRPPNNPKPKSVSDRQAIEARRKAVTAVPISKESADAAIARTMEPERLGGSFTPHPGYIEPFEPNEGYFVSKPNTELVLDPKDDNKAERLTEFVKEYYDGDSYIGTWYDIEETQQVYLDLSIHELDKMTAVALGKRWKQLAIYGVKEKDTIRLDDGSFDDFDHEAYLAKLKRSISDREARAQEELPGVMEGVRTLFRYAAFHGTGRKLRADELQFNRGGYVSSAFSGVREVKRQGLFFTPNKNFAKVYAKSAPDRADTPGGKPHIIAAEIILDNPIQGNDEFLDLAEQFYEEVYREKTSYSASFVDGGWSNLLIWQYLDGDFGAEFVPWLQSKGHDGVIWDEEIWGEIQDRFGLDEFEPVIVAFDNAKDIRHKRTHRLIKRSLSDRVIEAAKDEDGKVKLVHYGAPGLTEINASQYGEGVDSRNRNNAYPMAWAYIKIDDEELIRDGFDREDVVVRSASQAYNLEGIPPDQIYDVFADPNDLVQAVRSKMPTASGMAVIYGVLKESKKYGFKAVINTHPDNPYRGAVVFDEPLAVKSAYTKDELAADRERYRPGPRRSVSDRRVITPDNYLDEKGIAQHAKVIGPWINYLTTREIQATNTQGLESVLRQIESAPSIDMFVNVARVGGANRFWYENADMAMRNIFGDDWNTFAAVIAATSPQQPVKGNIIMAARVMKAWDDMGRPTDPKVLRKKLLPKDGVGADGEPKYSLVDIEARVNNTIRALSGKGLTDSWAGANVATRKGPQEDISGFKVTSFHRNLTLAGDFITNDTWMAAFLGYKKNPFGVKSAYNAMNAVTRKAAEELGWEPHQVQASVWSAIRAVTNETRSGVFGDAISTMQMLTPEDISVTDGEMHNLLLNDPEVRAEFEALGKDLGRIINEQFQSESVGSRSIAEEIGGSELLQEFAYTVEQKLSTDAENPEGEYVAESRSDRNAPNPKPEQPTGWFGKLWSRLTGVPDTTVPPDISAKVTEEVDQPGPDNRRRDINQPMRRKPGPRELTDEEASDAGQTGQMRQRDVIAKGEEYGIGFDGARTQTWEEARLLAEVAEERIDIVSYLGEKQDGEGFSQVEQTMALRRMNELTEQIDDLLDAQTDTSLTEADRLEIEAELTPLMNQWGELAAMVYDLKSDLGRNLAASKMWVKITGASKNSAARMLDRLTHGKATSKDKATVEAKAANIRAQKRQVEQAYARTASEADAELKRLATKLKKQGKQKVTLNDLKNC